MKRLKNIFQSHTFISFSIIGVILVSNVIKADITPVGDIDPVYPGGTPDPWNVGGDLTIGNTAVGSIDVNDGSKIISVYGYVGRDAGSDGTVTITDPCSYWTNSSFLYIGFHGDANMYISNGGHVTNTQSGFIGYHSDSTGLVTITGPNSLWETDYYIHVGYYSDDANMIISNGGHVSNSFGYIGFEPNSTGMVTVTGPNSLWENSDVLYVGRYGDANMLISDGGNVMNSSCFVGGQTNAEGYVIIMGPDSLWENSGEFFIGDYGDANMLVSNGGKVTSLHGYIGFNQSGIGIATITGPNSLWENSERLYIGYTGDANMVVSDRGHVKSDDSYIGYGVSEEIYGVGSVIVTGTDSLWENTGHLYIGGPGNGNLEISNGGRVTNVSGIIANTSTSNGTVTITGTDSLWENSWNLHVGREGDAYMLVSDGGKVTDVNGYIGFETGSYGLVTITGPNSLWQNSKNLYVGFDGDANMVISDGGNVIDANGYIGYNSTETGSVTVTGSDSLWENTQRLNVGYDGDANMVVSDGGKVTNIYGYIALESNSMGSVTVTGPNSLWENTERLFVGYDGEANMRISDGGKVTGIYGYIAHEPDGVGSVTVTGPNSLWESSDDLRIGYRGDANMLISDGGHVINKDGYIGRYSGSSGTVTVTGPNSLWENTKEIFVGYDGEGNLLISNGGHVTNTLGRIGSMGSVTVTGPNSLWENSDHLRVSDGDLVISNGGRVTSKDGDVGGSSGSSGVIVDGPDSLWTNSDDLDVGTYSGGSMVVSDGGRVTNSAGCIGCFTESIGSVTVTGPNSLWNNSSRLYVGRYGEGSMVVSDGGQVTNTYASIGRYDEGSGSVSVTGPNSLWHNSSYLHVGFWGDANMAISNGGKVINTNGFIGYVSGSNSVVTVTGPNSLWQNTANLYVGGLNTGPGGTGLLDVNDNGTVEANDIYIWSTGTISGNGNVDVAGQVWSFGGTFEPGNSIGTMNIDGDLTMDPNSTFEVEVDNSGNSDLLTVTGDVDIQGGTVKVVSTETITGTKQYTIIEANSIDGTFDTLDTALLDTIASEPNSDLGYGSDYVQLQIMAVQFDDLKIPLTNNQKAVGGALQKIADGGGNDITTAVQRLETGSQVRGAYDQLCGQTRPQLAPVTTADTGRFMGTVSDGMHRAGFSYGRRGSPLFAMAGPDTNIGNMAYDTGSRGTNFALGNGTNSFGNQMWGFWGKGYGLYGDRDSESSVPGYKYTIYGTSFGFDYQVTEQSLLGITAGFSKSDVDYSLPSSKADISGTHIGIYGSTSSNDWHFDSILTYSFLDYETERFITLMGQKVRGDFDGTGINGYLEARYDWRSYDSWFVQPLASFQFSCLSLDSYIESGGTSRLMFDDQSYQSYKGSLGLKATKELFEQDDSRIARVQLRCRWLHEFGDDNSSVDASFATNPGTVFKVADADVSRDSIVLGTGLNSRINEYVQFTIDYDLSLNSDETAHLISAALQYRR